MGGEPSVCYHRFDLCGLSHVGPIWICQSCGEPCRWQCTGGVCASCAVVQSLVLLGPQAQRHDEHSGDNGISGLAEPQEAPACAIRDIVLLLGSQAQHFDGQPGDYGSSGPASDSGTEEVSYIENEGKPVKPSQIEIVWSF